jgi:hypothetical protein
MECPPGVEPFEIVTLTRERNADGTPIGFYTITGEREGSERSVRVPAATLLEHADNHLEHGHGVKASDPINGELYRHAIKRASVALLID